MDWLWVWMYSSIFGTVKEVKHVSTLDRVSMKTYTGV